MSARQEELVEIIHRLSARFVALEKRLVFQHAGVKLYASEIHCMMTVDYHPDINVSAIAKRLGVTKGAISQTLSRLEGKGILVKESAPYHGNELRISLTRVGKDALAAFHARNSDQWSDLAGYSESLGASEYEAIIRFLTRVEDFLNSLK